MRFDESVVKIDCHNASYDPKTSSFALGPTYKVFHDSRWNIGVSLHKWSTIDGPRKGNYIAFAILKAYEDDSTDCTPYLNAIESKFSENKLIFSEIENGGLPPDLNIQVFKFSVNVWRPVVSTKSKWAFDTSCHKPAKEDPCFIQRLLKN